MLVKYYHIIMFYLTIFIIFIFFLSGGGVLVGFNDRVGLVCFVIGFIAE